MKEVFMSLAYHFRIYRFRVEMVVALLFTDALLPIRRLFSNHYKQVPAMRCVHLLQTCAFSVNLLEKHRVS